MSSRKNTFNLMFYLNRAKTNNEGAPIMLRITINGSQVATFIRRRVDPEDWNQSRGTPYNKDEYTREITLFIETLRSKAYAAFTELTRDTDHITAAMIRDYMFGIHNGEARTILAIWDEHNTELKKTIGKQCSYTLWQKHNTTRNHFHAFLKSYYRMEDMPIASVKYNVIREFHQFLMSEKQCNYNTSTKFLQFLKKITMRAMRSNWLKNDPFDGFKLSMKETDRPYLDDEELQRLVEKHFETQRLEHVCDLFLFSCYTGLAYADVAKLSKAELERTPDGMWWIKTRRQKTKQRSQIPLLDIAKRIIDKYADISQLRANDKVLPVLSNQKLNAYLKEIADLCQIEKKLTYHVARHTFATTVTLQNGVSIESVSRMLGHSNIKSTQHYARIVDKKIAQEMMGMSLRTKMEMAK